jgi:hypothetical protein
MLQVKRPGERAPKLLSPCYLSSAVCEAAFANTNVTGTRDERSPSPHERTTCVVDGCLCGGWNCSRIIRTSLIRYIVVRALTFSCHTKLHRELRKCQSSPSLWRISNHTILALPQTARAENTAATVPPQLCRSRNGFHRFCLRRWTHPYVANTAAGSSVG